MSKILVDRNELERVRDGVVYILEKGRNQGTIGSEGPQTIHDNTYKLDEKEKQILEYLKKNPGSTKEDVVKNVNDYSRVTVLIAITRLLEGGVIITIHNDKRNRINHLYVNFEKAIFSLQQNLGVFQYSYSELIDKAIERLFSKQVENGRIEFKTIPFVGLFYKLLGLYKFLCIMYITSDIFLWSSRPLDIDTLHNKFEHFFNTLKEIHHKLLEIPIRLGIKSEEIEEIVCSMLCKSKYGFSKGDLSDMLRFFEKYNLGEDFEPVVDALWALSYSILPLIDPSYKKHHKNGTLKDWRHIFKGSYKPKTKQWFTPF